MHANSEKISNSDEFVRLDDHQRNYIGPAGPGHLSGPSPKEGCSGGCVTRWMSSLPKKIGLMNPKGKHYHKIISKLISNNGDLVILAASKLKNQNFFNILFLKAFRKHKNLLLIVYE